MAKVFSVGSANEVNINDILRETPDDEPFVALYSGDLVLVCARVSYLDRFVPGDGIFVCDDALCDSWGSHMMPKLFSYGNYLFARHRNMSDCEFRLSRVLDGWRVATNTPDTRELWRGIYDNREKDTTKNLVKSLDFTREIVVGVCYASDFKEVE